MDYAAYEEILTDQMMGVGVVIGLIVFILVLVLFFRIRYIYKKNKKTARWNLKRKLRLSDYCCIVLMCFSLFLGVKYISEYNYDVQNQAYIVWNGDFVIEHYGKSSFLYIPDEDGLRLEGGRSLFDGEYTGQVIYGEKSKIVLEIHVDEDDGKLQNDPGLLDGIIRCFLTRDQIANRMEHEYENSQLRGLCGICSCGK